MADLGTPDGCTLAVKETQDRLGPVDETVFIAGEGVGGSILLGRSFNNQNAPGEPLIWVVRCK